MSFSHLFLTDSLLELVNNLSLGNPSKKTLCITDNPPAQGYYVEGGVAGLEQNGVGCLWGIVARFPT
jgi:hypothetical protein